MFVLARKLGVKMPRQRSYSGRIIFTSEKPIISTKEARKILGNEYKELSEDNLLGVITSLTQIAQFYLGLLKVPNNKHVC